MIEINKIWKIYNSDLRELLKTTPAIEKQLEDWIEKDVSIISPNLILIGRQVTTDFGGAIDLLAIDRAGNVVVIELKKEKTPRNVVAQVLDYASWISELPPERISEIARDYLKKSLEDAFRDKFGVDLPEIKIEDPKMIIVAIEADESTKRVVKFLSEKYGMSINIVNFDLFRDESGNMYLLRTYLLDPSDVERKYIERERRKINKESFLSACDPSERRIFERIFEFADGKGLRYRWGSTGCTIRVPLRNKEVILLWCYSPLAAYGSQLYIDLRGTREVLDEELKEVEKKLEGTEYIIEAGESLKLDINRELSEAEVENLVSLLNEIVEKLKSNESGDSQRNM